MDQHEEHNIRQSLARIEAMLRRQHESLERVMKGQDDLKQAIADNAQAMITAANTISADALKLAAAATGDSDDDIEELANKLKANTAQFNLAVSNATNPPAPAPQNTGGSATVTADQQAHADAAAGNNPSGNSSAASGTDLSGQTTKQGGG